MIFFLLPFLGFVLSFFSRFIGKTSSILLSISSVILCFFYAAYFSIYIFSGKTFIYTWNWIILENLELNFKFLLDPLSITMTLLITFITSLVMIYSTKYLEEDPSIVRFISLFALFDTTMIIMVTSGNYVQFFLGWEGVGLISYLLISFWHTRNEANKGALKAVLMNRIGDVFFMFALALMWLLFKSFDYSIIFNMFPEYTNNINISLLDININLSSCLAFCILGAAFAKSAQFLLHTWLPDAMEGPTPVSSLLHSATMVTAGIFLIIRSSFIFTLTPKISMLMTVFGILTALVSGLIALNQFDLKRIIAYSTCSQLGFMTFACGLGYYNFALFHLTTHAFFKCLLFLSSGAIIHALSDEQDIRKMGKLFHLLPITFSCMLIGTLALTGFPFLAGYYSKDFILETAYASSFFGFFIYSTASIAAFLTSFYSMRSLYLVFFGKDANLHKKTVSAIHESSIQMTAPMIILTILAIISGYIFKDIFVGPTGVLSWGNSMSFPMHASLVDHEYISLTIKLIPTFLGLAGLLISYLYHSSNKFYISSLFNYSFINLTTQKFYIDNIYNSLFARFTVIFGYIQYTVFDRGFLEKLGPYGLVELISFLTKKFKLQSGFITHYLLFISGALLLLLFFFYQGIIIEWPIVCLILIICLF